MTEYIELIGSDSSSLKLTLQTAKLCGTFGRMFEMTESLQDTNPISIPVPFQLDTISELLHEYLKLHEDNPEFSSYATIGLSGNRQVQRFEQWTRSSIAKKDDTWVNTITDPVILHRLYQIADYLELPSLMDLISYNLNKCLFDTLYNASQSSHEKAKHMRLILLGGV